MVWQAFCKKPSPHLGAASAAPSTLRTQRHDGEMTFCARRISHTKTNTCCVGSLQQHSNLKDVPRTLVQNRTTHSQSGRCILGGRHDEMHRFDYRVDARKSGAVVREQKGCPAVAEGQKGRGVAAGEANPPHRVANCKANIACGSTSRDVPEPLGNALHGCPPPPWPAPHRSSTLSQRRAPAESAG